MPIGKDHFPVPTPWFHILLFMARWLQTARVRDRLKSKLHRSLTGVDEGPPEDIGDLYNMTELIEKLREKSR